MCDKEDILYFGRASDRRLRHIIEQKPNKQGFALPERNLRRKIVKRQKKEMKPIHNFT
jgi:hypothetical protein